MNQFRLVAHCLAGLLAFGACATAVFFIYAVVAKNEPVTADMVMAFFLFECVLAGPAIALYYVVRRLERRQRAEAEAAGIANTTGVVCEKCDSLRLVQGHETTDLLLRKTYHARCLDCGKRLKVTLREWRGLPLPDRGDSAETWADKKYRMRRAHMSSGQSIVVLLGIAGIFVTLFSLYDEGEVGKWLSWNNSLFVLLVPFVLYALWWIGGRLFPAERASDNRCSKCGSDLRETTGENCSECGAAIDCTIPSR